MIIPNHSLKWKLGMRDKYIFDISQTVSKSISIYWGPKIYYSNSNLLTFLVFSHSQTKNLDNIFKIFIGRLSCSIITILLLISTMAFSIFKAVLIPHLSLNWIMIIILYAGTFIIFFRYIVPLFIRLYIYFNFYNLTWNCLMNHKHAWNATPLLPLGIVFLRKFNHVMTLGIEKG